MIDVCLVVEGNYPYLTGGVSAWADGLLKGLPDVNFAVAHVRAEGAPEQPAAYAVPAGVEVVHVDVENGEVVPQADAHGALPEARVYHATSTGRRRRDRPRRRRRARRRLRGDRARDRLARHRDAAEAAEEPHDPPGFRAEHQRRGAPPTGHRRLPPRPAGVRRGRLRHLGLRAERRGAGRGGCAPRAPARDPQPGRHCPGHRAGRRRSAGRVRRPRGPREGRRDLPAGLCPGARPSATTHGSPWSGRSTRTRATRTSA